MKIQVEPYSEKYQKQIENLILDIQQNEFNIPISLDQQPDLKNISTFYQKSNGNFWIALDDDVVVGTIALVDIGNQQAALRKMFVHKDYRGKEIKTANYLLNALIDWSKSKRLVEIYLGTTAKFLAAHRFYEKNGFSEVLKERLPKKFPLMDVDTKFYVLAL